MKMKGHEVQSLDLRAKRALEFYRETRLAIVRPTIGLIRISRHVSISLDVMLASDMSRRSRSTSYVLVLLVLAFGLMSKPMLLTVPFVLLLLGIPGLKAVCAGGFSHASPAA